jgi:late competence protein required for DNA uptake (superfamily II DNA/RNA helicase)
MWKKVILRRIAKQMKCHRCGHGWRYTGKNSYFCCCPICRTTVTIDRKRTKQKIVETEQTGVRGSSIRSAYGDEKCLGDLF